MNSSGMDDLLSEEGIHLQEILLAASCHDLEVLNRLLDSYSFPDCKAVDVQDPETGFSPLHAAIAACETEETGALASSTQELSSFELANGMSTRDEETEGAKATIRCLLENGAIWNQLDKNDETPGCIAKRLHLQELYDLMVDAGVRAELLLGRLQDYEQIDDDDDDEEAGNNEADVFAEPINATSLSEEDSHDQHSHEVNGGDINSANYLSSRLSHSSNRLLDDRQNGVMMAWEAGIMSKSADSILDKPELRVLNIGFGMGIIDSYIQSHRNRPAEHHIIEAHPDVLAEIERNKWDEKPGVVIHKGRWQDALPTLLAQGQMFDAIYFDTFAESYSQFREFFSEYVIGLLEQGGRWSFFNGMGADRQISYDVYQKVVEVDLFEAGFDVDWQDIDIPELDGEWEGVRRSYWNVGKYRLPICKFMD